MKATGVNVIVKPLFVEKTEGGILVPKEIQSNAEEMQQGEVVSVGNGQYVGGKMKMDIKKGDRVLFKPTRGMKFTKDKTEYRIFSIVDLPIIL